MADVLVCAEPEIREEATRFVNIAAFLDADPSPKVSIAIRDAILKTLKNLASRTAK
jgi:hypothetical protein